MYWAVAVDRTAHDQRLSNAFGHQSRQYPATNACVRHCFGSSPVSRWSLLAYLRVLGASVVEEVAIKVVGVLPLTHMTTVSLGTHQFKDVRIFNRRCVRSIQRVNECRVSDIRVARQYLRDTRSYRYRHTSSHRFQCPIRNPFDRATIRVPIERPTLQTLRFRFGATAWHKKPQSRIDTCIGIGVVEERALAQPPLDRSALVEVVVVVEAVLVVGRVGVDHRGHPQNDAHAERMELLDHLRGVGIQARVPHKVVEARRPVDLDVDRTDLTTTIRRECGGIGSNRATTITITKTMTSRSQERESARKRYEQVYCG